MFNCWSVLYRVPSKGHAMYMARCQCGTEKIVTASNVVSGASRSCGCLPRDCKPEIVNIGQIFGRWTVISESIKGTRRRFLCRCNCGTERILSLCTLKRGASCICVHIAQRQYAENGTQFSCQTCGREKQRNEFYETVGYKGRRYIHTFRCRQCVQIKQLAEYRTDILKRMKSLASAACFRARQEGYPFEISYEWLVEQFERQHGRCYYTGVPLSMEVGDNALSVDKKVPRLGYVPGNVVLTSWRLNNLKGKLTDIELIELSLAITRHRCEI